MNYVDECILHAPEKLFTFYERSTAHVWIQVLQFTYMYGCTVLYLFTSMGRDKTFWLTYVVGIYVHVYVRSYGYKAETYVRTYVCTYSNCWPGLLQLGVRIIVYSVYCRVASVGPATTVPPLIPKVNAKVEDGVF